MLWMLSDNQGTIRDIVNGAGVVQQHISYDSFGNIVDIRDAGNIGQADDALLTRYLYTGREYDNDTDAYYYRARWYDPRTGRFISKDPIGFAAGDANLYRYVGNRPTNATDPSGLDELVESPIPGHSDKAHLYYLNEGLFGDDREEVYLGIYDKETGNVIREGSDGNTYIVPYERVQHEAEGWGTTTDNWTVWFREQVEKDGIFLGHSNAKWFIDLLCGEGSMQEAADRINNALNGDRKELRRRLGEADEEFYDKSLDIPIVGYALAITIGDDIRPGETQRCGQDLIISGGIAITVGAIIKYGGKLYRIVKDKAGRAALEEVAAKSLTNADIDDLARSLKEGKIKSKDLKKFGYSPEDIADIEAKSKQIRTRSRGTDRIIDQIGKSKERVKNALERVRRSPNDAEALRELQAAQQQLAEIQAAQQDILSRGGQ